MTVTLDFESQLHTVPIRNQVVRTYPADHNPALLIVEVALTYRGLLGLLAPLVKARRSRRYELSGVSRELYEKLDGKLSVEDLVVELAAEEQLTFLEGRALVVQYLKDLMQRGLIVIVPEESVRS